MDKVFKTAVILTAQDEMSRKISEAVDKVDRRLGRMAWSAQQTGRSMMQTGAAIGASLFLPIKNAIDFEAQMSKVGAVSRASGDQIAALSAEARRLGAVTDRSASEAAQAMEYLSMAGLGVEEQLKSTEGVIQLAGSAGTDLGRSADIATNILGGFRMEVEQLGRVNDTLVNTFTKSNVNLEELSEAMKMVAPIASGLGAEIEEVSAMVGLLGDVGIKGTMAGTALRAAYQRLAAPTGAAARALDAMNISVADADGNMRPLTDIIGDMADATESMGNVARTTALKDIFGERAAGALSELMQQAGGDEIRRFTEEVGQAGAAAETYARMLDNTDGSLKESLSALEALSITIGTQLLPTVNEWIQRGTVLFRYLEKFARENEFLTRVILKLAMAFSAFLVVGGGGLWVFGNMLDLLRRFLPLIKFMITGWGRLAGALAFGLRAFAATGSVVKALIAVMRALNLTLLANPWFLLAAAAAGAVYLIYRYWEPIKAFFSRLWGFITAGFEHGFIYGILNVLKMFNPTYWIARAFNEVSKYLFGIDLFEAGANVVKTIWRGIKSFVNKPIEAIAGMAQKIRNYLPFSPAKEGPLRDLHRVKIVETVAEAINPRPVQEAMGAALAPSAGGFAAAGAGGVRINYSPTVYVGAGTGREQFAALLEEHGRELLRKVQQAMEDYNRTKF